MRWDGLYRTRFDEGEVGMMFRNCGSLIVIFLILMMIFGTSRLKTIGDDLACAIRNFRKGLQEKPEEDKPS